MYLIIDINNSFYAGENMLNFCHFYKDKRLAKVFDDKDSAMEKADKINKNHAPGYCKVWDEINKSIVE